VRSIIFLFLVCAIIAVAMQADGAEIDLERVKAIESGGRVDAVSFRGAKYGRGAYQISEICLAEYNKFNKTSYKPENLFDYTLNKQIASWYLNKRIPAMLKYYKKSVTVDTVLWAYNAGIGRVVQGIMPAETKIYIAKYKGAK
jgi:soluble lytic murein transglycosylase-like protein